jgi:hypothetical protein
MESKERYRHNLVRGTQFYYFLESIKRCLYKHSILDKILRIDILSIVIAPPIYISLYQIFIKMHDTIREMFSSDPRR